MNKKLDAKKYWKSFEILAVKVVKIQIKEIVKYEDLKFYEDEVPLTRDHGIDGQLHISLKGNDISITVEAKLRAKGPLGIKEFACLLYTSSQVFGWHQLLSSTPLHYMNIQATHHTDVYKRQP